MSVDHRSLSQGQQQELQGSGWVPGTGMGIRGSSCCAPLALAVPLPLLPAAQRAGLALPRSHPVSEKLSNESRSAKSDSPLAKGCDLLLAGLKKK